MVLSSARISRILFCIALIIMFPMGAHAAVCKTWQGWENFKTRFISEGGRVIDPSTAALATTSEGQSYALLFALIANDRAQFAKILEWTENNLAEGDLTARLPAWLWGRRDNGSWGVMDANAASDADLWIAYALAEAGRLWMVPKYTALAQLIADRVLREETLVVQGLGRVLLPGPVGFRPEPGVVRLNPSYLPIQLLRRFAELFPHPDWKLLLRTSVEVLHRSAPQGFAPDWVIYRSDTGFQLDAESKGEGSYNAIRVYLWAGMLAPGEAERSKLLNRFLAMARQVEVTGVPPLMVASREGTASGVGPAGFSGALLPFLAAIRRPDAVRQQRIRLDARMPQDRSDNYYDQVLTLFGLGWIDGHFRFESNGTLSPRWICAEN